MKILKLPWYFLKGLVKMVTFCVLIILFTICYILAFPVSIGGYKNSKKDDASDIVWNFFSTLIDNLLKI